MCIPLQLTVPKHKRRFKSWLWTGETRRKTFRSHLSLAAQDETFRSTIGWIRGWKDTTQPNTTDNAGIKNYSWEKEREEAASRLNIDEPGRSFNSIRKHSSSTKYMSSCGLILIRLDLLVWIILKNVDWFKDICRSCRIIVQ